MKMKESLQAALQKAQSMSAENPELVYYVMDKKRKTAAVHSLYWAVKEKILEGWSVVFRFKNGEKY
ncbi:MAG: hypothetical protein OSJ43_06620 [Oscillospiraceae bacterium]|nr:hypothetical protein [Oscillospiraceae bacterium]